MKTPRFASILSKELVAVLAAILVVLAVLQYRWTAQLSQAERERMQSSLDTAVNQFRQEFYRELMRVCAAFQVSPLSSPKGNWEADYIQRYQDWTQTNSRPDVVVRVFILNASENGPPQLLLLNPKTAQFQPADWPPELEETRRQLESEYPDLRRKQVRDRCHLPGPLKNRFPPSFSRFSASHRRGSEGLSFSGTALWN